MKQDLNKFNKEVRRKGVGGSEVAAILGLDEFSSPYKVWLDKTGRESSTASNKYTEAGLFLEQAVADYFEDKTRYRIIKASVNQKTVHHPKYEFVIGTPDRTFVKTSTVGKGILECKTTQRQYDEVPEKWFMQLQWYLGIMGLMYGAVAWLERGLDFKYSEYEFDPDFFEYMLEAVAKFWTENVVKDIPPEPINAEDIIRIYKAHREGAFLTASPEIVAIHSELVNVRQAIKEWESKEKQLTDTLKMEMKDCESIVDGTRTLVTWRQTKPINRFDSQALMLDHPDIYDRYMKQHEGDRRFLVK